MTLTSMLARQVTVASVPALDDLKLIVLSLLVGIAGIVLVRRKLSTRTPA